MKRRLAICAAAFAGLAATPALAADRVAAAVDCRATGDALAYDCIIRLRNARTSAPLEQASVTVGADMPAMPMAHNVRPVVAKPTGTPGEYQARLTLEMYGDWALRLKIGGPLQDQVVEIKSFNEKGSGPPRRKGAPSGSHKH
jgi:YtkA-like